MIKTKQKKKEIGSTRRSRDGAAGPAEPYHCSKRGVRKNKYVKTLRISHKSVIQKYIP